MVAKSTTLSQEQKMKFLADAKRIVATLRRGGARLDNIEYAYVYGALAIMSGHFRNKDGKPNPTAAAGEFDKKTTRSNAGMFRPCVPSRAHAAPARCARQPRAQTPALHPPPTSNRVGQASKRSTLQCSRMRSVRPRRA